MGGEKTADIETKPTGEETPPDETEVVDELDDSEATEAKGLKADVVALLTKEDEKNAKPDEKKPAPKKSTKSAGDGDTEPPADGTPGDGDTEPPAIPDNLTAAAKAVGLTDEDIAEFEGNPGLLGKTVTAIAENMAKATSLDKSGGQKSGKEEPGETQVPEAKEETKKPDPDFLEVLDDGTYDESMVSVIKGLNSKMDEGMERIEKVMSVMADQFKAGQLNDTQKAFDEDVSGLGEDWVETFGAGPLKSLDNKSAEFNNRSKLASMCSILSTAHPEYTRAEVAKAAAGVMLPNRAVELTRRDLLKKTDKRSSSALHRPKSSLTPRRTTDPTNDAVRAVTAAMRKKGQV